MAVPSRLGRTFSRLLVAGALAAPAFVLSSTSGLVALQNPPNATASGADLYHDRCASCHEGGVPRAPARAALNQMSADSIRFALTSGSMRGQASSLTPAEIDLLVRFLAAPAAAPTPAQSSNAGSATNNSCAARAAPQNPFSAPFWNGWGVDASERRFQPQAMARLTADDVPKLALKWAFGFPGVTRADGQPTVVGGRVFVGSVTRKVYSLDARTGCQYWAFDADAPVRTAVSIDVSGGNWTAYFGDGRATAYAVNALTGALRWKRRLDDHASATITGAPTLSGGVLYVPMSSSEEAFGADPKYGCCTFRGSVSALDAGTGAVNWKTYTIAQPAAPTRKNAAGTQLFGPSGAAVWDSPAVDRKLHRVYVTTGDSYSDPTANTSDAFIAMDADTGAIVWSRQMTTGDAYTMACGLPDPYGTNCPEANGPDFDFGSSPMLVDLPNGRRALIAGQKSGVVHALDPDHDGAILWQTRVGKGGRVGGVQWGSAADASRVYVALSDAVQTAAPAGTPGAQPTALGVPLLLNPKAGGGLFALDPQTGANVWTTPHPACSKPGCSPAQSAAVTVIPGVVFSGGLDGHLRAYAAATGQILWDVDTEHDFSTVNGVVAHGGSLDGPGAVVVDGMLYVNSGYAFVGGAPGNVLLAFSVGGT
jgi:polyvinyl alcohol dehydrogenase (cytochrome)